jgi:hypothetical protein
MEKKFNILVLLIANLLWLNIKAQEADASATMEKNSILIGDQINIDLRFTCTRNSSVIWPEISDTLIKQVEVINKLPIDSIIDERLGNQITYTQQLVITSFDSGYFALPPFTFIYKPEGSEEYLVAETEALLINVQTVPVDMNEDIKDIKPTIDVPLSFAELWPWLLGGLLLILFILGLIYYLRQRKRNEPIIPVRKKPQLPPHQVALDELDKLRAKKLWQSGRIKEYHTELTDIVRKYISGKFNIHASEMVTGEILEAVENIQISPDSKSKLKEVLELADLVKFAKEHPLPDEEEKSMNYAIDFVKETIILIEEETGKKRMSNDQ